MNDVDLNLLPSLHALLELRSVSKAAERVHLSQPAMSAALSRLRHHFNDELLVRAGRTYELTPFAQALVPRVETALMSLQDAMQLRAHFDPATSDRTFVVAASDYAAAVLVRHLRARLGRDAPGVTVNFVSNFRTQTHPGLEVFGSTDVVVGPVGFDLSGSTRQLFRDEFLVVMDPANPLLERETLTLHDIARAPQAVGEFGGSIVTPPTQLFQHLGEIVSVAARVTGLQALPLLVEGTDMVALVPRGLAARFPGVVAVELAPDLEVPLVESMFWHPLQSQDPANQWLRDMIRRSAEDLEDPCLPMLHPVRIDLEHQN